MGSDELSGLLDEAILDHCRNPRNSHKLQSSTLRGRAVNPFCGDEADIQIGIQGGHIAEIGAQGVGCSINLAATSMLSQAIKGRSLEEADELGGHFRGMMRGDTLPAPDLERLGDLKALSSVRQFPVRIKCALLALSALEEAADNRPA